MKSINLLPSTLVSDNAISVAQPLLSYQNLVIRLSMSKMAGKVVWRTLIALLLSTVVNSNVVPGCVLSSSNTELCSMSLGDVTVVIPGEFIVAKIQCYGCPTAERLERGHHRITHKDNALVCTQQ